MDVAISTLLYPIILFFALGMGAALLRSQMSVPEAVAKGMALYLMMAIGLKGGVEIATDSIDSGKARAKLEGLARITSA